LFRGAEFNLCAPDEESDHMLLQLGNRSTKKLEFSDKIKQMHMAAAGRRAPDKDGVVSAWMATTAETWGMLCLHGSAGQSRQMHRRSLGQYASDPERPVQGPRQQVVWPPPNAISYFNLMSHIPHTVCGGFQRYYRRQASPEEVRPALGGRYIYGMKIRGWDTLTKTSTAG
jgi:hypothetical protein